MDLSEQPRTGAAQRRKQRRLRSWWRHEQQSIAAALATSLHHSSRGQRKARAWGEESELHYTDKDRKTPLPQPVLFSLYEEELGGRRPYADNLKCTSRDPDLLLNVARFTTGYVRLVGQEPAPSKCILLSTSREVRHSMKGRVLSQEGDNWSVRFDVRDLGGHLDTFRGWSSTLAARVRLVISRLILVFVLPLDFYGRVRVVRSMYLPAALHGIGACSLLIAYGSFVPLFVVLFGRQPLAGVGAVLSLLHGPTGCDPFLCWFRFRLLRRYLALGPVEVGRIYRLLELVGEGCPGHGPIHLLSASAAEVGFRWDPDALAWVRPGLPLLRNLAGPLQHFKTAILDAWRNKVAADLCGREGFRGGPLLDVHGSLQLLNSSHV